jgi:two-component system, NtrC family, sensor kinase
VTLQSSIAPLKSMLEANLDTDYPHCERLHTGDRAASVGTRIGVLLIDDQTMVSEVIQRSLRTESDIDFYYCNDPTLAISMAIDLAPSVILQDLVMPDVDGLMLLRWFRLNPDTKDIPMVVLSCKEDAHLKAEAFTYGANDYLIKLPDAIELIARIRYHAQAYENLKALRATTAEAQAQSKQLSETLVQLQDMQAHIIQAEKMTGLGQMVAGIAHEINNPINFIHGNIQHFHGYIKDILGLLDLYTTTYPIPTAEIQDYVHNIDLEFVRDDLPQVMTSMKAGADRIRNIILSLRNFARLDEAEKKTVDLHDGLDSTLMILSHRLQAGIQVTRHYGNLPRIQCYPSQMNQVFLHLINNALDAIEDQSGAKHLEIRTQLIKNDRIQMTFHDNGPGISSDIQSKIFEPFFTTKPVNKGTGLGLSICYKIMQKHDGSIELYSQLGKGTTLTIELPIPTT